MSRTDKDRPIWVKLNDPSEDRKPYHQHFVILADYTGDIPVYRNGWNGRPYVAYTRGLYKRWSEGVECTLDRPETSSSSWTKRHCGFEFEYHKWCSGPQATYAKRKSNQVIRHDVRQQLNEARYVDPDELDIYNDSKYSFPEWWD